MISNDRIENLTNQNVQLRADINTAQEQIERLEIAQQEITAEEPNFNQHRQILRKQDLGDDAWRGGRKLTHAGLRDNVESRFDVGVTDIEDMLSAIIRKKQELQSQVTSMQNTISTNDQAISEEKRDQ
ncbi:DUF5082 family protein [Salicibibacter cibarius]|uniref:DUF5082 family protein n=1 Tax=Salicibibacter cibarius TaxID=2743000 RepID=A0A7T6Z5X5_9BACI|nr:DUF5082 family protein [Salicibibacter cibarius]QQK77595.1 DUF5082 family protein [Salicibibacter cibarius]